jgi:hypothetical protein
VVGRGRGNVQETSPAALRRLGRGQSRLPEKERMRLRGCLRKLQRRPRTAVPNYRNVSSLTAMG